MEVSFMRDLEFLWLILYVFLPAKSQAPDKAPASNGSSFNQLLGIKGASQETVSHVSFFQFHFIGFREKLYMFMDVIVVVVCICKESQITFFF